MSKLAIIGAGIAGLTCGIYARMNGFETDIYEMHTVAGGECTGWDRKGYHFDGCLHWLVGSKPGSDLNSLWWDVGALDESVKIFHYDIYTRYEADGAAVNFYTDIDKLEAHFNEISPVDRKVTAELCRAMKKLASFSMPLDKPIDMMTAGDGIKFAAKNLDRMGLLNRFNKMKISDIAAEYKSPMLRQAILTSFPGDYTALAFISTLGGMNVGDCGFPLGGSRAVARRMEAKFLGLGGSIHYRSKVDHILIEDGRAVGIRLSDGCDVRADDVISCADGYDAFTRMLGDAYTPEMYRKLFNQPKKYPTITSALVFAGVDSKIPYEYRGITVQRDKPVTVGGVENGTVSIYHYGFDGSMAPEGKTVLTCYYAGNYDYWNELAKDPEAYKAEKKKLEADALAEIIKRYPEAEGKIEVTDVVTPKTYERFCNAWRGSWMTWASGGEGVPQYFPGVLPGLKNFIIAGMWTLPPGGLPGAGASGRYAAQRLCMQHGVEFKTK